MSQTDRLPPPEQRPVLLEPTAQGDETALARALIAAARAVLRRRQQGAVPPSATDVQETSDAAD